MDPMDLEPATIISILDMGAILVMFYVTMVLLIWREIQLWTAERRTSAKSIGH